jgi:hypothetical protein
MGALDAYNEDIIKTYCRKCTAENQRCKGGYASLVVWPHKVRLQDAGYRWDKENQRLEKL